jgi:hypothetical protein
MNPATGILYKISIGELIDKITILELKMKYIKNNEKRNNISHELEYLKSISSGLDVPSVLMEALVDANEKIWIAEDKIREKEKKNEFDDDFISHARTVYYVNDDRAETKKQINIMFDSEFIEEKSHTGDYKNT